MFSTSAFPPLATALVSGQPGDSYTEKVLDDGTVVKQRRSVKYSHGPGEDMAGQGEVVSSPRQEEEVEDTEEIMPDGTVHHVHKVHRHSVKVTQKALRGEDGEEKVVEEKEDVPGSRREEVVETFQEPPRTVHREEVVDEVLPDGTHVTRKLVMNRMVSHTHTHQESFDEGAGGDRKVEDFDFEAVVPGTETTFVEAVGSSDSPRQEEEVEDTEEIMPDGTVHHVHKVHRHSVKVTQKALRGEDGDEKVVEEKEDVPGSRREEVVETFQEPPRSVHQEEVVDEVLPDGTHVTRKLVMNRMVSHTHTHQESFDEGAGGDRKVEDFDFEEVVPGTETAFLEAVGSSDEEDEDEELSMHQTTDVRETTEVLDDGSVVKKTLLTTEKSRQTRSRSGSLDRSETSTHVEEETVVPSPRPRSPVDGDYGHEDKTAVKRTVRTAHYEEDHDHGTVEQTLDMVEDMLAKGTLQEEVTRPEQQEESPEGNLPAAFGMNRLALL